ncbi:MAG: hypothetical protein M3R59_02015 [Verrucomicrobiota bacterium]|nr:hypothetical protein [Verrucomicrobiota bacterium]
MKTFEEKWTAWVDDQLTGRELEDFEAALPDKAAAWAEKKQAHQLGTFLREQLSDVPLSNADFFNHQINDQIGSANDGVEQPRARSHWWTIPRLVWSGAASLAVFAICAVFVLRNQQAPDQSQYLSQILNARVDPAVSPNASISMFEKKDDRVTVLWVEGLQSLPSEYAAQ